METYQAWLNSMHEAHSVLELFFKDSAQIEKCVQFTRWLCETIRNDGNIFTCGNGGSHCDSMHFAEEFTGRYRKNRRPIGALALGDPSHLTCVANDFGFEHIFSRQLEGLGRKGDLLVGISTSGNSENVCKAVKVAQSLGIRSIGLLGKDGGKLKSMVDLPIVVPAHTPERIQELHIKIIHSAVETVERTIFPEQYAQITSGSLREPTLT